MGTPPTGREVAFSMITISRFEDEYRLYRVLINVGDLGPGEEKLPADETYDVSSYPRLRELAENGRPHFTSVDDPDAHPAEVELLRQFEKTSDMSVAIEVEGHRWR